MHIRLGHACNSSSTHSLIFLKDPIDTSPYYEEDADFGWDNWVATKSESKINYLTYLLRAHLAPAVGYPMAYELARRLFGADAPEDGYIDHQSLIVFPKPWGDYPYLSEPRQRMDPLYIEELVQFISLPEVIILGGSDNDPPHPMSGQGLDIQHPFQLRDRLGQNWYSRKDEKFGHWTLYHPNTGDRLRFNMLEPEKPITCSSLPELVDLKITDHCPFSCPYCYMDSTADGKHASLDTLRLMLELISDLKVFEVAVGGGEPTLHPDFDEFLSIAASRYQMTINLTTRNMNWLEQRFPSLEHYLGAVAFSISEENASEMLPRLTTVVNQLADTWPVNKLAVQVVEGTVSEQTLRSVLRSMLPVTLLGYKYTGRGPNFTMPYQYDTLKVIADESPWDVSADTVFVTKYQTQLDEMDVPLAMREGSEGLFSMYIDAVEQAFGPSSFCDASQMTPLTLSTRNIVKARHQILELFPYCQEK